MASKCVGQWLESVDLAAPDKVVLSQIPMHHIITHSCYWIQKSVGSCLLARPFDWGPHLRHHLFSAAMVAQIDNLNRLRYRLPEVTQVSLCDASKSASAPDVSPSPWSFHAIQWPFVVNCQGHHRVEGFLVACNQPVQPRNTLPLTPSQWIWKVWTAFKHKLHVQSGHDHSMTYDGRLVPIYNPFYKTQTQLGGTCPLLGLRLLRASQHTTSMHTLPHHHPFLSSSSFLPADRYLHHQFSWFLHIFSMNPWIHQSSIIQLLGGRKKLHGPAWKDKRTCEDGPAMAHQFNWPRKLGTFWASRLANHVG